MREEDKYGNKFTVYVDDFIPRQREDQQSQPVGSNTEDNSDLPF
jgi:hypothetical protein